MGRRILLIRVSVSFNRLFSKDIGDKEEEKFIAREEMWEKEAGIIQHRVFFKQY